MAGREFWSRLCASVSFLAALDLNSCDKIGIILILSLEALSLREKTKSKYAVETAMCNVCLRESSHLSHGLTSSGISCSHPGNRKPGQGLNSKYSSQRLYSIDS